MKRWIALCLSALLMMGCNTTNNAKNEQNNEQNNALQTEQKNSMENEPEYVFYLKEGEIFYTDLNKNEPKQLTEGFADKDTEWNHRKWGDIHLAATRVFFPDKGFGKTEQDTNQFGFNIYCRDFSDKNGKNMLVDNDILYYEVSDRGEFVTYQKVNDDSFYQWHDGKVELIGENPAESKSYHVSSDGKRIVFYDKDYNLYYKEFGKEKELIDQVGEENRGKDSSADSQKPLSIEGTNRDLSVIVYQKEEDGKSCLYQKALGSPSVKLGEYDWGWHVFPVRRDAWHYFRIKERVLPLSEFVEDDLTDDVNSMRAQMKNADEKYFVKTYRFWYMDDEEFKSIDGEFFEWNDFSDDANGSFGTDFFYGYPQKSIEKVKLSQYKNINDLSYAVHKKLSQSAKKYVPIRGRFLEMEQTDRILMFDDEYTSVRYYEPTGGAKGDLYQCAIDGDEVGEPQKILSDVVMNTFFIPDSKEIFAYMSAVDGAAELFVEGKKIDSGRGISDMIYDERDQAIYYQLWGTEKGGESVLKVYRDGETKEIAEFVNDQDLSRSGKLIYIGDWKLREGGDLYFYDGEKSVLIDNNVRSILEKHPQYW